MVMQARPHSCKVSSQSYWAAGRAAVPASRPRACLRAGGMHTMVVVAGRKVQPVNQHAGLGRS